MSTLMLSEEEKLIGSALVSTVENSQVRLEYGELSKAVASRFGIKINPHFGFRFVFDKLSRICHSEGLPLISAIVVNKSVNKPGPGFFKLFDELNGTSFANSNVFIKDKLLKEIKNDLLSVKDWSKFKKHL